jgi:transposase-like protein
VPQDRAGRFSTELFERYQRSERALAAALAEMYVQGVSTRKGSDAAREVHCAAGDWRGFDHKLRRSTIGWR